MKNIRLQRLNSLAMAGFIGTLGLGGSMAAQAANYEIYGLIDIGLEQFNDSNAIAGNEIFQGFNSVDGNNDAKDFTLSNGMQSRLGLRGSEELMQNLVLSYNLEFALDVLAESGGGTSAAIGTRLGNVSLGGDWGRVVVGSQWMPLFEYGAWNVHRTDVHGYGTWFYTTGLLSNSLAYGFRQSSAISYKYGSAWGHSDPIAFSLTAGIGEGDDNQNGISSLTGAIQYSINNAMSVNAVYLREFNSTDAPGDLEPSLLNVGARWNVTPQLELGVNYTRVDRDVSEDEIRQAYNVSATIDLEGNWDTHLGIGAGDDDRDGDMDVEGRDINVNIYGFTRYAFTDRTNMRLEYEYIDYDGDMVDNGKASLFMLALQHNF